MEELNLKGAANDEKETHVETLITFYSSWTTMLGAFSLYG